MTKKKKSLVFLPLGGSGEIGMNMNLFGYGYAGKEKWIMVDCGITFGDAETPGIDVIMPDHSFIKERKDDLVAIILTHAHEDHIGAIAHLWSDLKAPIYATAFTARMVADKFADLGVDVGNALNIIPLKVKLSLGDFEVEFVSITHSIPEPNGLFITTDAASVYHTGDWKFDADPILGDATDYVRIKEIAELGVDVCICDSTNALDSGYSGSESDVLEPLIKAIESASGRVAITTFASNVARMKTLMRATVAAGRHFVLCGRSVERIYNIGREMGYFGDLPDPVPAMDARNLPKNKIVCICTGSQGEPRSALGRIARGNHPFFDLSSGDTVIFSSKTIPGNEKAIFKIYNMLAENNVDIITTKSFDIHVSGHPCAEELKELYRILKPTSAIPVHGEIRHMNRHAQIAKEMGVKSTFVPKNGDVIEISKEGITLRASVEAGRIYVDGRVLDSDDGASSERKRLTYAGYAVIHVCVDKVGNLLGMPSLHARGLPDAKILFGSLGERYYEKLFREIYESLNATDYESDTALQDAFRLGFRRAINHVWGKKPITDVHISRLDVVRNVKKSESKKNANSKEAAFSTDKASVRRR